MENLKQGTRVAYNISGLAGNGTIVGQASNGVVFIGKSYIIQPDIPINNKVYDYSHFVCYELYFKVIN